MAMRNKGRGKGSRGAPYDRPGREETVEANPCAVFVGNLSFDTTWKDLKDYFAAAGTVTRADVKTRDDGKSRGMGLVTFSSEEEAEEAINSLNETDLDGRQIIVRADKGGGGGTGGGRSGGKGGKGKGGGKGGKAKGKGRPSSKEDLDGDLDSYWSGSGAPEGVRTKQLEAKKGNLDDDLDSYFAAKGRKE